MAQTKVPKFRFLCTLSEGGQIFLPMKIREVLGLDAKDIVKFEFQNDGRIIFSKDEEATRLERDQEEKNKQDKKKSERSRGK